MSVEPVKNHFDTKQFKLTHIAIIATKIFAVWDV